MTTRKQIRGKQPVGDKPANGNTEAQKDQRKATKEARKAAYPWLAKSSVTRKNHGDT